MSKKSVIENSDVAKELDKVEKQLNEFGQNVKDLNLDQMNSAPKLETEPQTLLSQKDIEKSNDIYLKPKRTISSKEKFNEKFREAYNFDKEYVHFIAENNEIIGDTIEIWTKPYAGVPAEFWEVPANKMIWGPRYLAEQIKRKCYHRLVSEMKTMISTDGNGQYFGGMVSDKTIQRLDARPVSTRKSVFMGAMNF